MKHVPRAPNPELARHLLEAALALLETKGMHGFGLREVAKRVDYTVTAVYRCYGGRDGLLEALRQRLATGLALRLGTRDEGTARDQLIRFGRRFLSWALDHPHRYQLLFETTHPADGPSTIRPAVRALRAILRRGIDSGEIPSVDEAATATILFALLNGMASVALHGGLSDLGHQSPATFVDSGVATWVDRVVYFVRDTGKPIG